MISAATKQSISPWTPMRFCIALSVNTVIANLCLSLATHANYGGVSIVFLCFVPMCFFFVGAVALQMQGEMRELRRQIAELTGDESTCP
jgi:hypothetical protein